MSLRPRRPAPAAGTLVRNYSLSHLSNAALLRAQAAHDAEHSSSTAWLLAHLAEIDARKLYRDAAYPSMYAWCVGARHYSEDCACKRICVARKGRELPAIFGAIADGRLHLSGVVLLAPYLTGETVEELLAAA